MLALVTKASDDSYYEFKEVNSVEDILKIDSCVVITPSYYIKNDAKYWDGFLKEDIDKLEKAKIEIEIYDDYIN